MLKRQGHVQACGEESTVKGQRGNSRVASDKVRWLSEEGVGTWVKTGARKGGQDTDRSPDAVPKHT